MKRIVCIIAVVVAALSITATAAAASDPRVPALQRKVAQQQRQIATLTNAVLHDEDLATCRAVYQSHLNYGFLNLFSIMLGYPQVSDTTPSDNGACQRVGIQPPSRRSLQARLDPFGSLVTLALRARG
jgi:hypothetical protein